MFVNRYANKFNQYYRRYVLPQIIDNTIITEQRQEEYLVMKNVPKTMIEPLNDEEKCKVKNVMGVISSFEELGIFKKEKGFNPKFVSHFMYLPIIAHKLNDYSYTKLFEHKSLLGVLVPGEMNFLDVM